ncbi:hypothetical protein AOC36_04470 [Erysipelothrix larvae]|uniref:UPF0735 ACT domain-containing protein AOC36_04470 n=1 Tax=Erysipelothrix larvae TaxID=1514105 RepID=A0A0X8GZG0_9FIRM|nr:ACT domain-containing protein [Erysipelothrix larvae]AMC93251.1 hypothetical protein AOC36_04470 [Erysipelothrix larvae]
MADRQKYYIIQKKALPSSILKVLEAQELLDNGVVKSISEATERVGISRSVFYKYQHAVKPFYKDEAQRTVTIGLNLLDSPGILSDVLGILATFNFNLLTINQTIPINGIANVTLTLETLNNTKDLEQLIQILEEHQSIKSVRILAGETI